jgi:serralysin
MPIKPIYTTSQIISQLTTSWGGSITGFTFTWPSTQSTITYSINTSTPTNVQGYTPYEGGAYLVTMTTAQVATAAMSFQLWDDLIAKQAGTQHRLVQTTSPSANITLDYSSNTGNATYSNPFGWVNYSTQNVTLSADQIWLSSLWGTNANSGMNPGGYGLFTMIHEIGHAIGLSHPGTYDAGNGGSISYANNAVYSQDNRQYTVMSYFGGYYQGAWVIEGTYAMYLFPQTPMVYDIAAIQALYGADTTTRIGNTIYGFNCNFDAADPEKNIYNFSLNHTPIFTIWDAGGTDTLDCSGYAGAQIINLTPGTYSSVDGMVQNVAIAFNCTIENAVGGGGNDVLIGTAGINNLNGGNGADIYIVNDASEHTAAEFADSGATGSDEVRFASATAGQTLTLYSGDSGIEQVVIGTGTGASAVTTATTALNVDAAAVLNALTITGNDGANTITGTAFNDVIIGGGGIDQLNGGSGADIYIINDTSEHTAAEFADTGSNEVRFASATAGQTLTLYSGDSGIEHVVIGTGTGALAVTTATTALNVDASAVLNALSITGNDGANTIIGTALNDVIIGGGGIDQLNGGSGADIYIINDAAEHTAAEFADTGSNEVRFASATANQTMTLYAGDSGIDHVVIGTGTGASAVTTATTALNVDASAVLNALSITGNDGANTIIGTALNDVIIGGAGIDHLDGGNGTDIYLVNDASEHTAAEFADSGATGSDEVRFASATAGQTLTCLAGDTGIEHVVIGTGTGTLAVTTATTALNVDASAVLNDLFITGNDGANTITGTALNDTLIGGAGIDHLDGGNGADIYLVNDASEHAAAEISDTGATGSDEVRFASATAGQTLTCLAGDTGIEHVVIGTGTGTLAVTTATTALNVDASAVLNALSITGNDGANTIIGTALNDVIIGGGGIDQLNGGSGADIYIINDAAEHTAAEFADTGSNEVRFASATANQTVTLYAGDSGIEHVVIGTGTGASAVTTATTALNIDASAVLNALSITGNDGANTITGTAFNDVIIGSGGIDHLDGGNGSDIYLVNDTSEHTAAEFADTGSNEVRFASATAGQTLTLFASDTGIEQVVIGTGTGSSAVTTANTTLNIDASAVLNALTITGNDGANTITGTALNDTLIGGAGIDHLDGGNGTDLYIINDASEHSAVEFADTGNTGSDEVRFASATAGQTLTFFAGDNGIEHVVIGTGTGASAVTTATTALNVDASAVLNALTITGNDGANTITGTALNDTLIGGAGIDHLAGGDGADLYFINDVSEHSEAEFTDTGNTGSDEVRFASATAGQTLTLYAGDTGIEHVVIGTGTGASAVTNATNALNVDASAVLNALSITGNDGANTITGTALNDVIIGGGGIDHLAGGNGTDLYIINDASEHTAAEFADTGNTGSDEVRFASATAAQTLTLFAGDTGIEHLVIGTGTGSSAVTTATTALNVDASAVLNALAITGNNGANTITGSALNDVIIGGGGIDHLDGGNGADIYLVNDASEHAAAEISDTGATGSDEVRFASATAGQTLTLFASDTGIEQVVIGTGTGSSAVTTANTTLNIDASAVLNALTLTGNAGANTITGTALNDMIIGGSGIDHLDGGNGTDIYIINDASEHSAAEFSDAGTTGTDDVRFASTIANQTLTLFAGDTGIDRVVIGTGTGLSALTTGTTALNIDASGVLNALTFTGNAGANTIIGTAYNDVIIGSGGIDHLDGGNGADVYYIVDAAEHSAAEFGDTGTSGIDIVKFISTTANQTLTLFAADTGIEQVIACTGTSLIAGTTTLNIDASAVLNALTLTGNDGANSITGTAFNDLLIGGKGIDQLNGVNGSDIYIINATAEHSAAEINDTGTNGIDEVRFAATTANQTLTLFAADHGIENVVIGTGTGLSAVTTGTATLNVNAAGVLNALSITGNAGANNLTGTAFNDTLIGGNGNDTLTGGLGADAFVFNMQPHSVTNHDTITDFQSGLDTLQFSKAVFMAITSQTGATLNDSEFWMGTGVTAGHDIDDRVVYDIATGNLYYDADGSDSGAAVLIALIGTTSHPALTHSDISIIV